MKYCRKMWMCLLLLVVTVSLSACGGKRPEATTVLVEKGGKLKQILVDPAPDYSVTGLQEYTEERISAYLEDNKEGEIGLDSCEEEDGVLYLEISYGSSADYAAFNAMDCFCGTLEEAAAEGIVPSEVLVAPDGSAVDFSALLAEHPEYRMLVLSENVLIQTNQDILCASAPAAITGTRTAVIGDGDAGTSGYFPRKTEIPAYLITK